MAFKLCKNERTVKLNTLLTSVKSLLGLSCIKWYKSEELIPYVISILEYLNKKLMLSGACTISQRLQEYVDTYEMGVEMIIKKEISDLTYMVGIDTSDPNYREDLFILTWGMLLSSIYMQLLYNYAGVLDDASISSYDCHSGCYQAECGALLNMNTTTSHCLNDFNDCGN